jgi:hypothetical protein
MRTRATRRRPLARRAIRGMAGLRRVSRVMRDPWWGPRDGWTPIICRRRGLRPRRTRRAGSSGR